LIKINIKSSPSIRTLAYTNYLYEIKKEYEKEFNQEGIFEIELIEDVSQTGYPRENELNISEDGKTLNGKVYLTQYWNNNRKKTVLTNLPTVAELIQNLNHFLKSALSQYIEKFSKTETASNTLTSKENQSSQENLKKD
jgi:hypothetical protein